MIYYTIGNVARFSCITDVIVTTGSQEVRIIAEQMDVQYHLRPKVLYTDNAVLELIIY